MKNKDLRILLEMLEEFDVTDYMDDKEGINIKRDPTILEDDDDDDGSRDPIPEDMPMPLSAVSGIK